MTAESQAGSSRLHRILLLVVLVLIFAAYSGTLGYEFVYDDVDVIVNNPHLTSWSYLPRYFTENLWSHQSNDPGIYYRPLFLIWLRINRSLFSLNTTLWHLSTLLAYLATVIMVYWLAKRLLNDRMTAVIAAMVFGLCPLHIETAAWVCGASEQCR
jgi:4-amino-4-deoxy-L-arabinose transferase-like glycosyltransferase